MAKAVGIDLGTTFSVVAYIDEDGKPKIIRNRDGDNVTPSVVNFDENGEPLVGRLAKEMSTEQDGTVLFVKNEMGNPEWKILVGTEEYNPETVSSIILKRLKEDAESILGEEIKDVVITVPAYFGDAQRLSTTQAGKIAGFNVLKIINEPTAAALAYGSDSGKDETLLVFDLGGGTFDVTIMRIENKDIRVLATGGNRELGGRNWDNEVINYLRDLVLSDEGIDLFEQEHGTSRLRKLAESAKIALSDKQNTPVNINLGNGKRKKIDLTREKFNELTASLNSQTIDVAEFTMEEAKLGWKDIDKFLLVGGSTRMPIIRELIEKHSGKKPSAELHPDEVVAMGAALQAAIILAGEKRTDLSPEVLYGLPPAPKDVCSRGLGITARNKETHIMENSIIMQRNTEIPGKRNQRYYTVEDNQTSLRVQVNEGDEKDLEYVIKIGEATMKLEPRPKDSPLDVSIEYDENQIVHINVYDGVNNKHLGEIKIERKSNMDDVQVGKLSDLIQKTSVN